MNSFDDFKSHFRLTRHSFETCKNNLLHTQTLNQTKGPVVDVDKSLLMFLWYIGNLESFMSISDRFGVSKSQFHANVKRIASTIVRDVMHDEIKWPVGAIAEQTSRDFSELGGIQHVICAIDGSHINIKAPRINPNAYYNRKKFHSLVLFGCCDSKLKFMYVWTGNPGSTHDATVMRCSELCRQGDQLIAETNFVLGDSAFPLLGWLITPFRNFGNLTADQRLFNTCHCKTRQLIERTFGLHKGRFSRLLRFDVDDIDLIGNSILSACVLHNVCMNTGDDPIINENLPEPDVCDQLQPAIGCEMRGVPIRQQIVQELKQL